MFPSAEDVIRYFRIPTIIAISLYSLWHIIVITNKLFKEIPIFLRNAGRLTSFLSILASKIPKPTNWYYNGILLLFGVLINLFGYWLTSQFPSILYFDMSGTAIVSLLLGPLYGMSVGAITNLILWLFDNGIYRDYLLAFAHTNLVGGFIWGVFGRSGYGIKLLTAESIQTFLKALIYMTAIPVIIITLSQYYIQINEPQSTLHFKMQELNISPSLKSVFQILHWFAVDLFRTIPDKAISVIFGIFIARLVFPISYFRALEFSKRKLVSPVLPSIAFTIIWIGILLIIVFGIKNTGQTETIYNLNKHWIFWVSPLFFCFGLLLYELLWRYNPKVSDIRSASQMYSLKAIKPDRLILFSWGFHMIIILSFVVYLIGFIPFLEFRITMLSFFNYLIGCYSMYFIYLICRESARQNREYS